MKRMKCLNSGWDNAMKSIDEIGNVHPEKENDEKQNERKISMGR